VEHQLKRKYVEEYNIFKKWEKLSIGNEDDIKKAIVQLGGQSTSGYYSYFFPLLIKNPSRENITLDLLIQRLNLSMDKEQFRESCELVVNQLGKNNVTLIAKVLNLCNDIKKLTIVNCQEYLILG